MMMSLITGTAIVLWVFNPNLIHFCDKLIVNTYTNIHLSRMHDAQVLINKDKDKSIIELEALLKDMEKVQKNVRLDPIKRHCFEMLTKLYEDKGQLEQAVYWYEKWLQFDDRDINAQFQLDKLLYQIPGRKSEGQKALVNLYDKFSEEIRITDTYGKMQLQNGEYEEAIRCLKKAITQATEEPNTELNQMWEIFWDLGKSFNEDQRERFIIWLKNNSEIQLSCEIGPDVKHLRIDPPILSHLIISNPEMILSNGSERLNIRLNKIPLSLNGMNQIDNVLKTSNEQDPFFYFPIPIEWQDKQFKAEFKANVWDYSQLIKLVEYYNLLGTAFFKTGMLHDSIISYKEALDNTQNIHQDDAQIQQNLHLVLKERSKLYKEIDRMRQNIKYDRTNTTLHCDLGNLYQKLGLVDNAINEYKIALTLSSNNYNALRNLSITYLNKRDLDNALFFFSKLIDKDPNNAVIYYYIAYIYAKQEKISESIDWLEKAISIGFTDWNIIKENKDWDKVRYSMYYDMYIKK